MMSLTSSGRTAAARCARRGRRDRRRPPLERGPVAGHPHHQAEPVQAPPSAGLRPPSDPPRPQPPRPGAPPSRSVPRKSPATNRARAPLRLITSSASGPVNRVLTGTSVAPALSAPSAASTQ